MRTVNVHQAKTHLSKLLAQVELGEEIIISNRGIPIAKLVPFWTSVNRRASLEIDRGQFTVPKDFNAPLPLHHRDPFDRMLIAQAQLENMTLVSADSIFRQYGNISILWAASS
jgi:prevent-host-death family protein